jgi:MFS family permease
LPNLREYGHDARLLILVSGLIAVSFFGVHSLLRGIYLLRLGFGPEYLGLYYAAGAATFMAMGMPSGALGARFGTRKVMLLGLWLTTAGMALLPVSQLLSGSVSGVWPIVSQVVLTSGWSMYNVNTVPALMVVTTDSNRSSAYALTSAMRGLGTFLGTLIGGALPGLYALLGGFDHSLVDPEPYSYALLTGALAGLLALGPVSRTRGGQQPPAESGVARDRGPFPLLLVISLVAYVFLRHTGWTTCQAFCTPYMDTDLALATSVIGVLTSVGQVAAILGAFMIPRLARRVHHGWIVALSTAVLCVSLLLLALVPHWAAVSLGLLGVQVSASLWLPALQVFQMELVTEGWRGLAYGAVTMAMGSGFGSMSLFGGSYIEAQGYRSLFVLGVGLSAVATVVMGAITRRTHRRRWRIPHL